MNIDEHGIREYTRRIDMTEEELRKHKASLMRISNRKRYIKRIIKQREEARLYKYKTQYLELVQVINNLNDNAPVITSNATFSRVEGCVGIADCWDFGTVAATDADGNPMTFSVVTPDPPITGYDFEINATSGKISLRFSADYETKNTYTGTVTVVDSADDGSKATDQAITLNITDVDDEAPVITSSATFSADENQTAIGTVTATDADNLDTSATISFAVSGSELAIDSEGVLTFTSAPDYETKTSYTTTITASDGASNSSSQSITVSINNLNDNSPAFTSGTSFSADENQTAIGTITASDADGDSVSFTVSGSELVITSAGVLSFASAPDYETKTSYTATVTATDGTNTTTQAITVSVTNINEAPSFSSSASFSAAENQTAIGTVVATDSEGEAVAFTVSGSELSITSAGVLTFKAAPDYETKSSYSFNVVASDGVNSGSKAITLSIANLNDNSPSFTSSAAQSLIEGNTAVGTIAATDADGNSVTYTLSGTNASLASLTSGGVLTLNSKADYESKTSYSVIVTATDGTNTTTQTITISVTNDTYDDISMPKKIQLAELKKENG